MSLAYLVDTDWVIDHFHGIAAVTRKLEELRPAGLRIRSDKRHLRRAAEIRPPLGTPAQHPGWSAS